MLRYKRYEFMEKFIRVVVDESGESWFVAADVRSALTLNSRTYTRIMRTMPTSETVRMLFFSTQTGNAKTVKADDGKQYEITEVINHKAAFVNESGLYRMIMRSHKAQARKFQDWVYKEVLPTLRKTGTYTIPESVNGIPSVVQNTEPQQQTINFEDDNAPFELEEELHLNLTVTSSKAQVRIETTFFNGANDILVDFVRETYNKLAMHVEDSVLKKKQLR